MRAGFVQDIKKVKRLQEDSAMKKMRCAWQPIVLLAVLLIVLCMVACSVPQRIVRSEFEEGMKKGEEFAQKDAVFIQCWRAHADIDPSQKARSYKTTLEDLLKSESFILGFYNGYETAYAKHLDSQCSP